MPRLVKILAATFQGKPAQEVLRALREDTRPVDVIMLPEEWQGEGAPIDTDDSALLQEFRALAIEKHAYVICPVDRPAPDGKCYNTELMIDREGSICAEYHKMFPVISELTERSIAVMPGKEVVTVDTDFGRVGFAICFDANFTELWQGLQEQQAEIIFFVSDYPGRLACRSLACLNHYYIVSATRSCDCTAVDLDGEELYYRQSAPEEIGLHYLELDLDRCIFHRNYNLERRDALLREHPEIVVDKAVDSDHWFILASRRDDVRAKELAQAYGLEPVNAYIERSRKFVNPDMRGRIYGGTPE